jgi:ABC-2 type transport system ATP-binding protein
MLRFTKVSKTFGTTVAVDGLDLVLEEGEIFGLLGPNGAGKSTSINMAVGLLAPDQGSVEIQGQGDPRRPEVRQCLGVAPQALAIYEELTGDENLRFFGRLYGIKGARLKKRVDWALEFVGLTVRRGDLVKEYSGGMKRRINLAAALLHDPKLLLLDEPTVGVDPQSRNAILEKVMELRDQGKTIIYTTHYMEEAERLCDRVGVIDEGKLLALDTVDGLIDKHGGPLRVTARTDEGESSFEAEDSAEAFEKLSALGTLLDFRSERPTLETVFLNLTGRRLRD